VHFLRAAVAASMHACVVSVNGGSGGRVVLVVVTLGFVVVVVFAGFSVVVVTPGRGRVEVDVDVLVTGGADDVVVVVRIVVVVTVGFGIVVVVVTTDPISGHFTRHAVSPVLQAWPSTKAWPVHEMPHAASDEPAQDFWQLASADTTEVSHCAFLLAQLEPQDAPLPGAKQLPTAALYGVTQSASEHDL